MSAFALLLRAREIERTRRFCVVLRAHCPKGTCGKTRCHPTLTAEKQTSTISDKLAAYARPATASGMNTFPYVTPRDKLLLRRFAAGKTNREIAADLGETESRIVAQRQRIAEKFEIRTHEQLVALANQVALWPDRNSRNLKVSGVRKHRVRPIIDVSEIKKMRADGIGQPPSRRYSKSPAHLFIDCSGIDGP